MANTTNLMSIAPAQPASSTRTTSQSTQPRYKSPTRAGKRNFSSTLDAINAKLDELKQSVKDLRDINEDTAHVEDTPEKVDAAETTPAQGKSDTPQDAPEKAIRIQDSVVGDDSEVVAEEESKPADIFLVKKKVPVTLTSVETFKVDEPKISDEIPAITDNTTEIVDEPTTKNIFAASGMAYLFNMSSESLLTTKPVINSEPVEGVQEIPAVQNLQTLLPQSKGDNAQTMLQMLGGRTWRTFNSQSSEVQTSQPIIQAQTVEIKPIQTSQPTIQAQPVEVEPVQNSQPIIQAQTVEVEPVQTSQPIIQAQPSEVKPVQTLQPTIQTEPVKAEPVQTSQPIIQTEPVKAEPVQTSQPIIQAQHVEVEPVQTSQPIIQAQHVEVEPVQTSQQTIQAQPVESEPVQTSQQTIQAQPVEVEPVQTSQPTIQAQPVKAEPVQTPQPTIQAEPVAAEPVQTTQPTIQAEPVAAEPVQTSQPTIQTEQVAAEPVQTSQPTIQTETVAAEPVQTSQPIIQTEPVAAEPVQTSQPIIQTEPVKAEPVQTSQATIQTEPVKVEPVQTSQPIIQTEPVKAEPVQTSQPIIQAKPVKAEPVQTSQPTIPTEPVKAEPVQTSQPTIQAEQVKAEPVQTSQPIIQAEPAEVVQVQTAQPILQQKVDERPALQNLSDFLGVNVQVEEAPTAAPVTAPQATPQQFEQNPQQQGESDFQKQIFQPIVSDEVQGQPVSTGGEIFAANLSAAANDTSQPQQATPTQALDAPPPPQDDFDIPAQIVKQARLIRTAENSEMVIKLNPEHLGELTLRVSVSSNGAVNASFHSDNVQVRTIIENSLVQLRQELNNAGLKVENVQVYAGLSDGGGLMNGQGGQAWQQNRRQGQGNRRIDLNSLERDIDATAPVNENSSTDGVDYSV